MKVNGPRSLVRFEYVKPGDCFRYSERVWLKTLNGMAYGAVDVENGNVGGSFAETLVEPVEVDARVS